MRHRGLSRGVSLGAAVIRNGLRMCSGTGCRARLGVANGLYCRVEVDGDGLVADNYCRQGGLGMWLTQALVIGSVKSWIWAIHVLGTAHGQVLRSLSGQASWEYRP